MGSGSAPQSNPMQEAQANAYLMQIQAAMDDKKEARAKAEALAKETTDKSKTADRVNSAYTGALNYGQQQLAGKGIDATDDPFGIMALYRASLDNARMSVPEISENPSSYFGTSLFDTAYDTARNNQRSKLDDALDEFAGYGFERKAFADTADDPFLDAILGRQKTDALTLLENAKARGQVNDSGFTGAMTDLDNMFTSGLSKANDLGGGVLNGYRTQLTDRAGEYRSNVQNYDFGDRINPDEYKTDLDALTGSLRGRLEGDILNAIGSTNFFDTSKLLATAGNRSGLVNPNAVNPSTTTATPESERKKAATAAGTIGAF